MASGGRADLKAYYAKEATERRRLNDVLSEQLSRDLLRLLNDEAHTDLDLYVGKTKFKGHKAVLLARVPKFYRFISQISSQGTITLTNVEPSEIQAFLKVVYSSHWSVKETEDQILKMIDHDHSVENQGRSDAVGDRIQENTVPETDNTEGLCDLYPASELGKDLLSLFQRCCCPDITIQTKDKSFPVHRAVLCARSSYFAAMLSGCWAESSQEFIQIQGINHTDMTVMMQFVYGAILDLPKRADVGHILSIADMYGLEGLKEVAIYTLKKDYCKFFHKPVVGLQQSVLECLCIAHSLGEKQLYTSCMKWIEKYFVKCWSERSFASLPPDLQRSCFTTLVQSLSYRNAAFLLIESDRLVGSLPAVKWAEMARNLALELQEECVHFMVTNFSQIIKTESFSRLLQAQGMSSRPYLIEQVFNEIEKSVSFQNSCSLFMALDELLALTSEVDRSFTCKIQALRDKLWTFLVQSFYAVRHTDGWNLMSPDHQKKIQAAAVDKGDDRRLGKKPVFTSSQNRFKTGELKETSHSTANRVGSECDLGNQKKMKSDSLGASGHTSVTRHSSGKGKEDDVKVKDGKKPLTKPSEKIVVTKPKTIVKTKPECNGSTKLESCSAKGDPAKNASPGLGGARPKATTNGTSHSQTKVKTLKKTTKEPASTSKSPAPSMKCNSHEGTANSNKSFEQNHDATSDERPSSTNCSPQNGLTGKKSADSSVEQGVATKIKPTIKLANGASIKRKVNDTESHGETNSSLSKKTPNEANEIALQKKKGIKVGNSTAQPRPTSAPAALSRKQGTQGNGTNQLKPVASAKQTEAKADAKVLNHSTSTGKSEPLLKKNGKAPCSSANKTNAKPPVPSSRHNINATKGSTANHKELKQKATNGPHSSKASNLNHRQEQKSSPAALKNSHSQLASGSDLEFCDTKKSLESQKNECNQAHCSPLPDLSGSLKHHVSENAELAAYESGQENVICHEDCKLEKPNSEQIPFTATVEDNQEEATYHSVTTDEVHIISSISGDQKPEGKNICDSENSNKCADSSSESELCSIKEVNRSTKQKDSLDLSDVSFKCPAYSNSTMHNFDKAADHCLQSGPTSQSALNSSEHFMNCISENQVSELPTDRAITETIERHENSEMHFVGLWNKCSGTFERESPESESGSASTSSDDIKPRSEDYDAGGSQDDDGSNERGISKCSTMRCHDFLGRSSSDTSTPEELKGYDGNLRIDVKMKKENHTDLFRVNSTSDDEGPRKRPDKWFQREAPKQSINQKPVCSNVQFPAETEHLSSSADETEDERSEAENAAEKSVSDVASQPFQGIVNLAFDDTTELDNEGQPISGNKKYMRSVLLSVDECEELGSDEGEPYTSQGHNVDPTTPSDVFETISNKSSKQKKSGKASGCEEFKLQNGSNSSLKEQHGIILDQDDYSKELLEKRATGEPLSLDAPIKGQDNTESGICKGYSKHPENEFKSHTRPCHLELYTTDSPSDTQLVSNAKTIKPFMSQGQGYQVKETHAPPTEYSNTALPAGHIDDFDSLAKTCMYDLRPSKSLSPIYEVDPGEGIEQKRKTEDNSMDFDFEEQQFVERDWILLRQLLADHSSDVDIINSVPEDLSLAQYLINQTLLLARENSRSQDKSHTELVSPFDDSTNLTMTSFSPDDCSSPHGEWTILELETHH
ncbi:BTB/POZ domain-containing protein 8 isoform X2 [Bombina bombina]|uniref:BTB/POZ domain-containing protein 8 isoform X2 n=1 Tax=Bombina bombina TaxID=8345 RepID=UPI00235AF892|nr:BTB/POZ domain-containing protein 8 isoform X2 [Bombina bombina]